MSNQRNEIPFDFQQQQQQRTSSAVPEQNVASGRVPVAQNQQYMPQNGKVPLSQAQMQQAQPQQQQQTQQQQYPGMIYSGTDGGYDNRRGSQNSTTQRPTADRNAFMGTETQERRASWSEMTPRQQAKQLESDMKDRAQGRKGSQFEDTKHIVIGGKPVNLEQ
ncbi:hypothetical protein INT45_001933 [Circinella minor]|uniref:Uncharacterized protein n=1 Tax=Circinella minor TaxID=1195481 RepID=A0A8H7S580_9FUNG|nr:hypothetical protein INT45_001933 [Circinella minor]